MSEYKEKLLNYEERLELMIEYIERTGKKIKPSTVYKGYNIGNLKNNTRQSYYLGKLNVNEDLIKRLKKYGIISGQKERVRLSTETKFDFLINYQGVEGATINGKSYNDIRAREQTKYNYGKSSFTEEQILELRKRGIFTYSIKDAKLLASRYGIPLNFVRHIGRNYGDFESFIKAYKKREIDLKYDGDIFFLGYRGIILSEQDITVEQKSNYGELLREIIPEVDLNEYLDINGIEQAIDNLDKRESSIIRMKYGLNQEKHSYEECGKMFHVSRARISAIANNAKKKLQQPNTRKLFLGNIKQDEEKLKRQEEYLRGIQKDMKGLKNIILYITDENGVLKENIQNINLSELGIFEGMFGNRLKGMQNLYDLINSAVEYNKYKLETPLEELNLSNRLYRWLSYGKIKTVEQLMQYTKSQLSGFKCIGDKSLKEIEEKLAVWGGRLRNKNEPNNEIIDNDYPQTDAKEILLNMCNNLMQVYTKQDKILSERIQKLIQKIQRYYDSYNYYINEEDIFNPRAIIPGIPKGKRKEPKNEVVNIRGKDLDLEL